MKSCGDFPKEFRQRGCATKRTYRDSVPSINVRKMEEARGASDTPIRFQRRVCDTRQKITMATDRRW
ncbi:hypothetical protein SAMN05446635_6673 [Burkholderia sp. OK233]|nr:hypothetical protein SAMN05446635_6673 [Burkholderia sp. OK233]